MAKIFLSVPVMDRPELGFIQSMQSACMNSKHQVFTVFHKQDSLISRARNIHISKFLYEYTDMDYFVSLDSDIEIVNQYKTNNIFDKLVAHNLDFVGGLYPSKNPKEKICSSTPIHPEHRSPAFDSGLIEMRWLSSGCWCLSRKAAEKMEEKYRAELQYDGDGLVAGDKMMGLYIPMLIKRTEGEKTFRKYLSEDWSFCERWKNIGGEIWADTSIVLKHIGQYPYTLWDVKVVKEAKSNPPPAGYDLEFPENG